ncbi:MAG TPA: efflux RND transporter periplasmic adaptor subunit [Anaerolineae bacterium]
MNRRWALIVVAMALAGCTANAPGANVALPDSTRATSVAPLSRSGFIEADDVTLSADVSAVITAVTVDEGQSVKAGQVLVVLDDTLSQSQRAQAAAALDVAQANLTLIQSGPRPDAVAAAQADVARTQAEYLSALRTVTDTAALVANPPGLEIQVKQAETAVRLAEQSVQQASSEREAAQSVRDKIPAGAAERDLQEKKLNAAVARVDAAKAQYDGTVAVLDQLNRMRLYPAELVAKWHAAQSQVNIAAAQVESAKAALAAASAGSTPEQVAVAQADVDTSRANLELIDAQLAHFRITSPLDGIVTRKLARVGEVARVATPLLVVSNLSELKLVVYVPASQMSRISVGESVRVSVNAYPGESFSAAISKVASKAEFTPSNVQTKDDRAKLVFAVTLKLPNPGLRLKAGMPADAVFEP